MNSPLVILEMANNHMGSLNHGKKIINQFNKVTKKYKNIINFAFKFQYRDSNTFIHKTYKKSEHSGVKRFESTFLKDSEWQKLLTYTKKYYDLICTPFDEVSVKRVFKQNFKYCKIASCSATDWPLLESIVFNHKKKNKKIIASLAGLNINEISKLISFFRNNKIDANYLYCVGKYPTNMEDVNLSYFKFLNERYGNIIQGFSSHESPDIYSTPSIAYGAGVRIFEKHVGVNYNKFKLNKYSLTIANLKNWLDNLVSGIKTWGSIDGRNKNVKNEIIQLDNFKRGVYLKNNLKIGSKLNKKDYEICYPALKNQVKANDLSKFQKIIIKKTVNSGKPLLYESVNFKNKRINVENIRDKIRNFLINKNVTIPKNSKLEISHHYGIENFYKFGITMINIINSKYCKKLIIMLPGQIHPEQYHKIKEESFFVLSGDVNLKLNGKRYLLSEGMLKTILPKINHSFYTKKGCIIEELSTTHKKNDSFYLDKNINSNKNRKSLISLY